MTRKVLAGETVYGVVELSSSGSDGDSATIWAECHDPNATASCSSTGTLTCGETLTLATAATSQHHVYACGDELFGGLYGREAVASFTAPQDTTLTITLPDKVDGFLMVEGPAGGPAGCQTGGCVSTGGVLTAVVRAGETVWVVADSRGEVAGGVDFESIPLQVECKSPYGACPALQPLACGDELTLDVTGTQGQIEAYQCGPPQNKGFSGDLVGPELGFSFTSPGPQFVRISSPDADLFEVGAPCDPTQCLRSNDELVFVFDAATAGSAVTVIADSFDTDATEVGVKVECLSPSLLGPCEPGPDVGCGDTVLAAPVGPSAHASWVCGDDKLVFGTLDGPEVIRTFIATEKTLLTVDFGDGIGMILKEPDAGGCSTASCAEGPDPVVTRVLDPGERVYIVQESTAAAPLVQSSFTVTCAVPPPIPEPPPGVVCAPTATLACGDTVTLPLAPSPLAIFKCGNDGFAGLDGPGVAASFTATTNMDVTINVSVGEGFLLDSGPVCDPAQCIDQGPTLTETMSAGDVVYVVVDTFAAQGLESVTLSVACTPPMIPPPPIGETCAATAQLSCGTTTTVTAEANLATHYQCSPTDFFTGQDGPEAVASFTAEGPTELLVTLPAGVDGVLLPTVDGACSPLACVDSGPELYAELAAGETVFVVVDSEAAAPLGDIDIATACVGDVPIPPEEGSCAPAATLGCGEPLTLLTTPSTASSYLCADGSEITDLTGPEAVAVFVAETALELEVDLSAGDGIMLLDLDGTCDPTKCVENGSSLYATLKAGQTVYIVADSEASDPIGAVTMTPSCTPIEPPDEPPDGPPDPSTQTCSADSVIACGETVVLATQPNEAASYLCDGDVLGELDGPEAVVSFTATEPTTVLFGIPAPADGVLLLDAGAGCAPTECIDSGNGLYAKLEAGQTVYVVADFPAASPEATASITLTCLPGP